MVIARHADAARDLSAQMAREREGAEKIYKAIVRGAVAVSSGVIDLPIGRAVRSAVYVKRGVNHAEGRGSRTEFTVERRGADFSLLSLRLRTGRRHQIRVHLAAIGHAVVGDKLYGPAESHYLRFISKGFDDLMRAELLAERHLLHAAVLEFRHPAGGRPMRFTAPLPPDMAGFLARAGLGDPAC
jgi:23S rRNA pseudouridine1911/1915/1917 synthase